ncbi:MAG: hypothetical protein NW217_00315 [Hyphomicrobiaceae bacterium]|nr:hypothetical protein [Hyphomicrobiaceae bacterium]
MSDRQRVEQQILALLPRDGTSVLNRAMMPLVGRRMGQRVDPEIYFAALDVLSAADLIVRHRGQGGKISRATRLPEPLTSDIAPWPEPKLMPSLGRYLNTLFWRGLDLPKQSYWKVVDTSMHGPQEKWGRPDFTAVCIVPLKVLGRAEVDIYSFELKAESAADVVAVHQALAQTRKTNYGYLVWHLPEASVLEPKLTEISEQCRRHGVGLIRIWDPEMVETWSIEVDPVRQSTALFDIDQFLAARLSPSDCDEIRRKVFGGE